MAYVQYLSAFCHYTDIQQWLTNLPNRLVDGSHNDGGRFLFLGANVPLGHRFGDGKQWISSVEFLIIRRVPS